LSGGERELRDAFNHGTEHDASVPADPPLVQSVLLALQIVDHGRNLRTAVGLRSQRHPNDSFDALRDVPA